VILSECVKSQVHTDVLTKQTQFVTLAMEVFN